MDVDYAGIIKGVEIYMESMLNRDTSSKEYIRGYEEGIRSVMNSLSVKTDPINYTETKLHFMVKDATVLEDDYEKGKLKAFKIALNRLSYIVVYEI